MSADLRLIRIDGPDDPLVPRRLNIPRDTTVGRAMEAGICLPSPTVSRRHAVFRRLPDGWCLTDEGSTGGTTLNGRPIEPGSPAPLEPGDRIGFGPWLFAVSDDETATRTIDVTLDRPTRAVPPISSRRLDALTACLDALQRAGSREDLAVAALRAAMDGTGFARGAVLLPPRGEDARPSFVTGLIRTRAGHAPLEPEGFAPSSSLISQAAAGQTAVLSETARLDRPVTTHSIAEHAIHSAVCVPVMPESRAEALIYLDARRGESPVEDAAGYCEDVARLYAFALTRDAQADLRRRQDAMRAELDRAREIRAMLAPPETGRAGAFRHASRTIAGLFVSADLFDTVVNADGSTTVLFGDASGHGVGAAMLGALVHAHLVSALASGAPVADAVAQTNRFVATRPTGGRFVSLVAARLETDGRVELIDAGHGHWLIAPGQGDTRHPARATSMPLGIDPDARFEPTPHHLAPGDRLVCFTDGIPDQADPSGDRFGFERLDAALRSSTDCADDVSRVFDALRRHAGGRTLDDDATVASVQLDPL
jgi:serine phosphatase RsbU (regulator of sigma subunit)